MNAAGALRPALQRATAPVTAMATLRVQRKCACGGETFGGGECAQCRKKREGMLRRSAVVSGFAPIDVAPTVVHEVLSNAGTPLMPATRALMESRFGHDFSAVRVHTDRAAAESARAVDAKAYTVGTHVVFGSGEYSPATREGQHLLAHELSHVRQQSGMSIDGSSPLRIGPASDSYEAEAHDTAARVMGGGAPAAVRENAKPVIQRQVTSAPVHDSSTAFKPNTPFEKYSESSEAMFRRAGRNDVADAVRRCREQGGNACAKLLTPDEAWALYRSGRSIAGLPAEAALGGDAALAFVGVPATPLLTPPVAPPVVTAPPVGAPPVVAGVTAVEVATIAIPVVGALYLAVGVYDLVSFAKFQSALIRHGYTFMPSPLGVCIGQCHTAPAPTAPRWSRAPSPTFPKSFTEGDIGTGDLPKDWVKRAPTKKSAPETKPAPKTAENPSEEEGQKCKLRPLARPLGNDPLAELFCDVVAPAGQSYWITSPVGVAEIDKLVGRTWYECKCGLRSTVEKVLAGKRYGEIRMMEKDEQILRHMRIARACGYSYRVAVASEYVAKFLRARYFDQVDVLVREWEPCE